MTRMYLKKTRCVLSRTNTFKYHNVCILQIKRQREKLAMLVLIKESHKGLTDFGDHSHQRK